MPKEVRFVFPKTDPGPMLQDTARYVINVSTGPDVEVLQDFIMRKMPEVKRDSVTTVYNVLYTCRNERTPHSFPQLRALIDVACQGNYMNEWQLVTGLYEVFVDGAALTVTWKKFTVPLWQKLLMPSWLRTEYIDPKKIPWIQDIYSPSSFAV